LTGHTIGHYLVQEKLGEGGMGEVYKALDTRLERPVAIKVLREDSSGRSLAEARTASALNHPNIITIYDIVAVEGADAIVMEFVAGKTLEHLVAGGALAPAQVRTYGAQIAAALAAAHEAGIVHRDVKPANVMVTATGLVKVMDFGLAKRSQWAAAATDVTRTLEVEDAITGTVSYMSPEQASGGRVDARSDIFSLGLLLYEIAAGRRAFEGATAVAVMVAILRDQPAPIAGIPAGLRAAIFRCLEKRPEDRFQSMAEVKAALEDLRAPGAPRESAVSLAVLPFSNLGGDQENDYFSEGLAEDILSALTRIPQLRVTARASAFAFRGRDRDLRAVAAALNVSHILEGSVRHAGNRIRVTAQLVEAASGFQLWSERLDREMTDIFAVQDEISRAIVEKLAVNFATPAAARRRTGDPEAYRLYLEGRYHLYRYTAESLARARVAAEQAIDVDPDFAPAHVLLADQAVNCAICSMEDPLLAGPRAIEAVERALALDAGMAEAHAIRGELRARFEYDWKTADADFRRAIELDPAAPLPRYQYAYWCLQITGSFEEAIEQNDLALERDPLSPIIRWMRAYLLYMMREDARARAAAQQVIDIAPDFWLGHWIYGSSSLRLGAIDTAIDALERSQRFSPQRTMVISELAKAYVRAGREDRARQMLEELDRLDGYVAPMIAASIHAALGETDAFFAGMERSVRHRDPLAVHLKIDPEFFGATSAMRADPRYRALLRQMNLNR
jgi:serine/threonine-protein kinase